MSDFAKMIINFRQAKKFSLADVSKRIAVPVQTISNWEHGRAVPGIEKIIALAELYGVSTDTLLGVSSATRDELLQDIILKIAKLSEAKKKALLDLLS